MTDPINTAKAARAMRAALEKGRQKLATYTSIYTGDKELRGLLVAWDAAIVQAEVAGIKAED